MNKTLLTMVLSLTLLAAAVLPAEAGCYRLGLTGYHWYHFCAGPHFLYPHHRSCNRHGFCLFH